MMKHFGKVIAGALVCGMLASCSTQQLQPVKYIDGYCEVARPIIIAKTEIPLLTRETKSQIYVHNETWFAKCHQKDGANP